MKNIPEKYVRITGLLVCIFIVFTVFQALSAITSDNTRMVWEVVQLSFVLGALVFAVNAKEFRKWDHQTLIATGMCFVLSGILILSGLGSHLNYKYSKFAPIDWGFFTIEGGLFVLATGIGLLFLVMGEEFYRRTKAIK